LIQCGCLVIHATRVVVAVPFESHPNKFGKSTPKDLKVGIFPVGPQPQTPLRP
jgi:hypothetical protein